MKERFVRRSIGLALILTALALCAVLAPAASAAGPVELFKWTAAGNAETNMSKVKDNLIVGEKRTSTHFVFNLNVQQPSGEKKTLFYYLREYCSSNSEADTYGLPKKVMGSGTYEYKATEELKLQFSDFQGVETRGLSAVNLRLTFGWNPKRNSVPVFALDKFQVQISPDGETWLEQGVGLRSWELLGYAIDSTDRPVFVYTLETENFLEIDGVRPGDRIADIRIRPVGEHYWSTGYFAMADAAVNGYATAEDWNTQVPDRRGDLLEVGEQTLRSIVAARADAFAGLAWTCDAPIYADSVSGTDYNGVNGTTVKEFLPGVEYHGPVYIRTIKSTFEDFRASVKDGVYLGGRTTGVAVGTNCTGYAYDIYSLVSRSFSWRLWETQDDNALVLLGDIKTEKNPVFTNLDIVNVNDEQTMYGGYALLKTGDVLTTYTTLGGIHHRLVRGPAVVVRGADGAIDPDKSYVPTYEQTSALRYYFETPDGSVVIVVCNTQEELDAYRQRYPGYRLLYGANAAKLTYTFRELRSTYYAPWTLKEYQSGKVEDADVQMLMYPTDRRDLSGGFTGVIGTDYHIVNYGVRLKDLDRDAVLFEDRIRVTEQHDYAEIYSSETLDRHLAGLTDGNYRIEMYAQVGPVTRVGADRPIVTRSMDLTVSGRPAARQVTLKYSAPSVSRGQRVEVYVDCDKAVEAADAEIKFDDQALSYVGGSADAGLQSVTCSGSIVHALCANASSGTRIAALSFTAREDIADMAQAVSLIAAAVVDGEGTAPVKASGPNDCPAIRFADVGRRAWYHEAVDYVYENNIMSGYSADTFGPDNTLTRAMVVQVLYNKENKPASSAANPFKDIASGQWYYNAVRWGADKGVVAGYGGGVFKPDDNVTIEQVAVILHNYSGKPSSSGDASGLGAHSDWADAALAWAAEKGIFNGMPDFSVTAPATRAQTAQMLTNFLK